MGTIAEKLQYLKDTKSQIKAAIVEKGVSVPNDKPFREYADLIRGIEGGAGSTEGLQLGEITPTGKTFIQYPDDGYEGFSRVIVAGDSNLSPQNIAEGVEIYGVTGTLKIGSTTNIPEAYTSYVEHAKTIYTGEYENIAILESTNHINVLFLMSDFTIKTFDSSTSEFTAIGFVICSYKKSEETWEISDYSTTTSIGMNYVNHIRYSSVYWVYNGQIIYPHSGYINAVGDGSAAVAYVTIALPSPYPVGLTPYKLTLTCGSNTLIGTYSSSGQKITYALPTTGTWKGVFTDYGNNEIATVSFDVTPYMYSKTPNLSDKHILAEDSWATISQIAKSGNAESYYTIGDEKEIELTTGETLTLRIIGFNHDVLSDGTGYSGITFETKHLMSSKLAMNSSDTNVGGWRESAMRTRLQPGGSIYNVLPQEVRDVIRPVNKVTSVGNVGSALETTSDYAFLLSEVEIFGSTSFSVAGEGKRYDYYGSYATTSARRIKNLANGTGSANYWWERSPASGSTSNFCYVGSNGNAGYGYAGASFGVSFGFCV